jgi:hypothetical protein
VLSVVGLGVTTLPVNRLLARVSSRYFFRISLPHPSKLRRLDEEIVPSVAIAAVTSLIGQLSELSNRKIKRRVVRNKYLC